MNMVHNPTLSIRKEALRQTLLGSIGLSRGICLGTIHAFKSVLDSQLKYDNSIRLNTTQISWITLSSIYCMMISSFFSILLLQMFGRKGTMLLMDLLMLISLVLIYCCTNFEMLISSRILSGLSIGAYFVTYIVFLGELTTPEHRSTLLTLPSLGAQVGYLLCIFLADYMQWRELGIVFTLFPIYNIAILTYLKESFVTFLDRDNIVEARKYFHWYRGSDREAQKEFDEILNDKENNKIDTASSCTRLRLYKTKAFLLPFSIVTLVHLVNAFTGVQATVYCTKEIIRQFTKNITYLQTSFLLMGLIRVFAVFTCIFIAKFATVRFMLLSSGYVVCVTLLALGGFMEYSRIDDDPVFDAVALISLITNVTVYWMGFGAFTSLVCGVMFPYSTRVIGISLSSSLSFLFLYLFIEFLPSLMDSVGGYCTMKMFTLCTFFGVIVIHLTLPQTKNKTLLDINRKYHS